TSLALYASLGFRVREPVTVMSGRPRARLAAGAEVRRMTPADLPAAGALARKDHGVAGGAELGAALGRGTPVGLARGGRPPAYLTMPELWLLHHAGAETEADLMDLLVGAAAACEEPIGFLLPVRHAALFHWCLGQGFAVVKPMTLMTRGEYREP